MPSLSALVRQAKKKAGETDLGFKVIRNEKNYLEHNDGCYITIEPNTGMSVFNYAFLTLMGMFSSGEFKIGKNTLDKTEFSNLLMDHELPCYSDYIKSGEYLDWEVMRKPSYIDTFSIKTDYTDVDELIEFLTHENTRVAKFIEKLNKTMKYYPTMVKGILTMEGNDKQMSDSIATINAQYKGIQFEVTEPIETKFKNKKRHSVFVRVIAEDFFPEIRNREEYKIGFDNPVYNETVYLMSEKISRLSKEASDKVFVNGVVGYDPEEDGVSKESICFNINIEGDYFLNEELMKCIDLIVTTIAKETGKDEISVS